MFVGQPRGRVGATPPPTRDERYREGSGWCQASGAGGRTSGSLAGVPVWSIGSDRRATSSQSGRKNNCYSEARRPPYPALTHQRTPLELVPSTHLTLRPSSTTFASFPKPRTNRPLSSIRLDPRPAKDLEACQWIVFWFVACANSGTGRLSATKGRRRGALFGRTSLREIRNRKKPPPPTDSFLPNPLP